MEHCVMSDRQAVVSCFSFQLLECFLFLFCLFFCSKLTLLFHFSLNFQMYGILITLMIAV